MNTKKSDNCIKPVFFPKENPALTFQCGTNLTKLSLDV
jgi:hypothetical protein